MTVSNWCKAGFVSFAVLLHPTTVFSPKVQPMVKHVKGTAYAAAGFLEYLPPGYAARKTKAPLLIAFHGRGENGVGNAQSLEQLFNNGIPQRIRDGQWSQPFVTLAPQHDGVGCPTAGEVKDFIQFAKSHYRIDEHRVYLTGLSCGARGIADYLAHYGGKEIAATVLVAGDLSPAWSARGCALARDLPIWAFHGDADDIVPNIGDKSAMAHLGECPRHREVKYDSYARTGHDAWTRAYATDQHDVYAWMLSFARDEDRVLARAGH